jgi:hypothetical protein
MSFSTIPNNRNISFGISAKAKTNLVAHLALFPRTTRRHVDRITFIPKRNRFRSTDDQHSEKLCRDDRETRNVPSPHSKTSNDGELALKRFMIKVNSKLRQVSAILNCPQP